MAQADSGPTSDGFGAIGLGVAGALVAAAIFVVLTAATGTTYHLFPLLIGFLPAGLPRVLAERPINRRDATIAMAIGIAAVGAVWLSLEVMDEMPTATLISDQPGGVAGEFALFGILGALIGGWWGSRPS